MDGLRRIEKMREEKEEHKTITEELLKKRRIQKDEVWAEFEDYTRSWERSKRRLTALQLNHSNDTRT